MSAKVSVLLSTHRWKKERFQVILANHETIDIESKRHFRFPILDLYRQAVNVNANYTSNPSKYLRISRYLLKFFLSHPIFILKMFFYAKRLNFIVPNEALDDHLQIRESYSNSPLWVSREAVKSNIFIYDLASSLEVELTAQQSKFSGFIWNLSIQSSDNASNPLLRTQQFTIIDTKNLTGSKDLFLSSDKKSGFGLLEIQNCHLIHGRYVTQGDKIFRQSDSNFKSNKYWPGDTRLSSDGSKISTLVTKGVSQRIDSAIFVGSHKNLFHFLYENLTRLSYLTSLENFPKTIIVSNAIPEQLLQLLEIMFPFKIVLSGYFECIEVGRIWLGYDHGFFGNMTISGREDSLLKIRQRVLEEIPMNKSGNRRIFIERPKGATRPIQNKKKLLKLLQDEDFVRVSPENLIFSEQVKLLNYADFIIGEEGAALTNLLFIKEGAVIIELQEQNMLSKMLFSDLSSLGKSKHTIIFGKTCILGNSGFSPDGFLISLRRLKALIERNNQSN